MNAYLMIGLIAFSALALKGATVATTAKKCTIKILSIDSFNLEGVEFVLSVTAAIDNPTSNDLIVKHPYLKLLYNGSEIANSRPSVVNVLVKGNERTKIPGLNIRMSLSAIPTLAVAVFDKKQTAQDITLETATIINGIPVTDVKPYSIASLVKMIK